MSKSLVLLAIAAVSAATVAAVVGCSRTAGNAGHDVTAGDRAAGQVSAAPGESGGFANIKCPITGSRINPANVTASLTRDYKGKKVAFCCDGCLVAWDKLSDAQKDAALKAVAGADELHNSAAAPAASYTCPMHPEVVAAKPGSCPKCGMALVQKK